MTELACQTTLLASIIVMVSQARAYFGLVPPVKGEGRVFDRRFWNGPPPTFGGRAGTLGSRGMFGGMIVGPLVMLREYALKVGANPKSSSMMLGGGWDGFVALVGDTGGRIVLWGSTGLDGWGCSWMAA